jgi:hypothetical protein
MLLRLLYFQIKAEVNTPPNPKTLRASTLPATQVNTTNRKSLVLLESAGASILD